MNAPILFLDNALTATFVSPHKCLHLVELGITNKTLYGWKIKDSNTFFPYTYQFDPLNLYKDTDDVINQSQGYTTIPAYTISCLEHLFIDYSITKRGSNYVFTLPIYKAFREHQASRLPDVYARVLEKHIKEGIWSAEFVNLKIKEYYEARL